MVDGGGEWSRVVRSGGDGVDLVSPSGEVPMFFGTYTPRLDDKGRLFLPAKFRDELAEGLVVTRGQERCLYVWSMAEFGRLTERLREAPVTNKAARDYVRMFFAGASNETPDKQGRITLPPMLREYASLSKDCIVIGAMNRIEIWDAAAWQSYSDEQEQAFADLSDEVFPGV
jgi:MraZ protein